MINIVFNNIYKSKGIKGFYQGVEANALRAIVLVGTQMSSYDIIKGYINNYSSLTRSDIRLQTTSAIITGLAMACTVTPIDMIRTTIFQNKGKYFILLQYNVIT